MLPEECSLELNRTAVVREVTSLELGKVIKQLKQCWFFCSLPGSSTRFNYRTRFLLGLPIRFRTLFITCSE